MRALHLALAIAMSSGCSLIVDPLERNTYDRTGSDACVRTAESCNGADDDCDGIIDEDATSPFWMDADGDGFGVGEPREMCAAEGEHSATRDGDCDDGNTARNPGANEACDDADDDCDGAIDEGLEPITCYQDADGDGYGATEVAETSCRCSADFVPVPGDCDEAAAAVHPGGAEVCDEIDNDCDDAIDEGLPQILCYRDEDGDTYGRDDMTVMACGCPAGYVSRGGDCRDAHPRVNPGADWTEGTYCTEGICCISCGSEDWNCDGVEERRYEGTLSTCFSPGCIDGSSYWEDGSVPGCGDPQEYLRTCRAPECTLDRRLAVQQCR